MITCLYEEVEFRLPLEQDVAGWLQLVAGQHGRSIQQLTYVFVSRDQLRYLNHKYLKHDDDTDILTFDYSTDKSAPIVGDVFIGIEQVRDNADEFGSQFIDEVHRVMVHGLLHICGFGDSDEDSKTVMRRQEDLSLNLRLF